MHDFSPFLSRIFSHFPVSFPSVWEIIIYLPYILPNSRGNSQTCFLVSFLRPLLDMKPEFRDYSVLYTEISRIAGRFEFRDIEAKAEALYDESRLCPTITEFLMQEEMEKTNAAGKGKK